MWRSKVKGIRLDKRIFTAYFNTSSTGVRIYSYLTTVACWLRIYTLSRCTALAYTLSL